MRYTILLFAVLAIACGDDDTGLDAGAGADASADVGSDVTLQGDVSQDALGDTIDRPDALGDTIDSPDAAVASCSNAVALEMVGGNLQAVSNFTGDEEDFFTFEAEAGAWYILQASAAETGMGPDMEMVLFSEGMQLAANDDNREAGTSDSQLIYRIPSAGTYCIRVNEAEGRGGTGDYLVGAVLADFTRDGVNREVEPNDSAMSAQAPTVADNGAVLMVGDFASNSDVEVFEYTTTPGALMLDISFAPNGVDGSGSTLGFGVVSVLSADGSEFIAGLNVAMGADNIRMPVTGDTTYLIEVTAASGALGSNPFWSVFVGSIDFDNQLESGSNNDLFVNAETATPNAFMNRTNHFIGGDLTASDVDWWAFEASAGDSISVACSARRTGSGALDMAVSLYADPAAAALQTETESEGADLNWTGEAGSSQMPVVTAASGTHYVSIAFGSGSANLTSRYYRCGIFVVTP